MEIQPKIVDLLMLLFKFVNPHVRPYELVNWAQGIIIEFLTMIQIFSYTCAQSGDEGTRFKRTKGVEDSPKLKFAKKVYYEVITINHALAHPLLSSHLNFMDIAFTWGRAYLPDLPEKHQERIKQMTVLTKLAIVNEHKGLANVVQARVIEHLGTFPYLIGQVPLRTEVDGVIIDVLNKQYIKDELKRQYSDTANPLESLTMILLGSMMETIAVANTGNSKILEKWSADMSGIYSNLVDHKIEAPVINVYQLKIIIQVLTGFAYTILLTQIWKLVIKRIFERDETTVGGKDSRNIYEIDNSPGGMRKYEIYTMQIESPALTMEDPREILRIKPEIWRFQTVISNLLLLVQELRHNKDFGKIMAKQTRGPDTLMRMALQ